MLTLGDSHVDKYPQLFIDGLREQFYVADSPSGINDRIMYVHTASYGSQVKVVKQDRLKSASQEDEADNCKLDNMKKLLIPKM